MLVGLTNSSLDNGGDVNSSSAKPLIGIGLDSCVIPLKYNNLNLIQTTDFFYPLVDDPYTMGRIACCNVLSDLYAMGVDDCDNMLMLLGVSSLMSEDEKNTAIPLIIQGFTECATEAGTSVQGGQTVVNPWLIIGGVATAISPKESIIMPYNAQPGDVIVLTKPLGTQVAVNAYQWMIENLPRYDKIKSVVSNLQIDELYEKATFQMAILNKMAASLIKKYKAHACTDVTGFGLLGHATNLVDCQKNDVDFVIKCLPCLRNAIAIDDALEGVMKLRQGLSPETSGGLFVVLDKKKVDAFVCELSSHVGYFACVIGSVEFGSRKVKLEENFQIIEV